VAECPPPPRCLWQRKTRDQAIVNIKHAIGEYLPRLENNGDPIPWPITEKTVAVAP
jgi:predicted RNase H-like HicB family nuclease